MHHKLAFSINIRYNDGDKQIMKEISNEGI